MSSGSWAVTVGPVDEAQHLKPSPDYAMLCGAIAATLGYLLPWFKQSDSYEWWFHGWGYASLSNGGGWTLMTFVFLGLALVASLWAGRSAAAAMGGTVAAIASLVFALAVVAASFSAVPERSSINYITRFPFGIGIPLLAVGLGLLVAGGARAIARTATAPPATR
jgi:hypothetical protein